jgi:hypothetical protein
MMRGRIPWMSRSAIPFPITPLDDPSRATRASQGRMTGSMPRFRTACSNWSVCQPVLEARMMIVDMETISDCRFQIEDCSVFESSI